MIDQQIDELSYAISEMKENNGERWTIKQMEAQKKKLEEQIKELTEESRKDDLITFEELGIDSIMVDEAHGFKNLAIFSKMNNVAGITEEGALCLLPELRSAIPCVSFMSCNCIFRRKP